MNEVYKNLKEEPFIMVAGEVHNSNSSTSEAMKRVWEKGRCCGIFPINGTYP